MTLLKTVLLGSAAGLLAVGAAQAADLPVKKAAAAVQYVEVCPVYGSGFYKLPGTDICIRHFGSMKFNFGFQNEREAWEPDGIGAIEPIVQAGGSNTVGWQWTIRPGWDFRSPTEYGTLRAVVQMRVDQRNGVFQDDEPVLTGTMRTANLIHRGYIEWAGFLIGRAGTQFVYWDQDDVVTAIGGDPKETTMQLTYVFTAPGGIKATIGLEDSATWDGGVEIGVPSPFGLEAIGAPGPQRLYDIVASLSTEQSWGSAKIAGLLHWIHTAGDRLDVNEAFDSNKQGTGWAVLGGVTFNLPMLGPKDQLLLQAQYCDGVNAACGVNGGAANDPSSFERRGQFLDGLQRLTDVDAWLVADGSGSWDFKTTKVWSVEGQLRHYWAPLWRSNLMASYVNIDVPRAGFLATGVGDANSWDIAANLIWGQSRKTAEIGVEVVYKQLNQDVHRLTAAEARRHGVETDPNGWAVVGFIQRNW
ncbi:MAG TPA: porin [Xanthobacteraceae bacterium]|nr:porin [Xanthobacteraceae bacterium]